MISSTHNPRIQQVRALLGRSKERREAGAFVIEGVRLVEEAWKAGWPVQQVLYSTEKLSERGQEVIAGLATKGALVEEAAEHVLASLSDTETSQGILAVLTQKVLPLMEKVDFVVVADTIRDPGNLGTLLRTAAAAGAQAALLTAGCADAFSPKVLRAGMGAHFHLPVLELGWADMRAFLKERSLPIYLADIQASKAYWQIDLRQPAAIMVANEAEGPSPEGKNLADQAVLIPMPGKSESLNAAVAAGILLFEVVRQRSEIH